MAGKEIVRCNTPCQVVCMPAGVRYVFAAARLIASTTPLTKAFYASGKVAAAICRSCRSELARRAPQERI